MDNNKPNNSKVKKKRKNKKKSFGKFLTLFIIYEIIFTLVTAPLIVFYGPFDRVKKTVVGTAMSTFTHQWIAKLFLSDAQIEAILKGDTTPTSADAATINSSEQDIKAVNIKGGHDSNIEEYDIDGGIRFKGYLLVIHDPSRVKVGYTDQLGVQGEKTSEIAKRVGAVAAINGGGFQDKSTNGTLWAGTGAYPTGFVISGGKVIYKDDTITNSTKTSVMGLTDKGLLVVGNKSINDLQAMGVTEAISFGPTLVVNGKPAFSGDGGEGINPRTAIGQTANGETLLLVIDGRHIDMPGATLKDVQNIMIKYGAMNAINLDGGSSTTMYYDGGVINNPSNPLGERTVSTIVYVKP